MKIYFWHNPRTDHILQGAGPLYDCMMPPGYERITCNHAHEAEAWSARLNSQDKRVAEMNDCERELFEGPMRADLRRELRRQLADIEKNKSKHIAAGLLEIALKQLDEQEAKGKTIRESWLHVEGYEHGHGE